MFNIVVTVLTSCYIKGLDTEIWLHVDQAEQTMP